MGGGPIKDAVNTVFQRRPWFSDRYGFCNLERVSSVKADDMHQIPENT